MASGNRNRPQQGDYEPILKSSDRLIQTEGVKLKRLLTNLGGPISGKSGMFFSTTSVQDYQLVTKRLPQFRTTRSAGNVMMRASQAHKLNTGFLPGIPTFNNQSRGAPFQIHPLKGNESRHGTSELRVSLLSKGTTVSGKGQGQGRPKPTAGSRRTRIEETDLAKRTDFVLTEKDSTIGNKETSRQAVFDVNRSSRRCFCGSSQCRCFCESKDEAGLVFTVPCSHHKKLNCSQKLNLCAATKVYFPFYRFKWKKRPEEPEEPGVSLAVVQLRAKLEPVKLGDLVLFQGPESGWFYNGMVIQDCGNHMYIVTDSNGHRVSVWRENIVCDRDRNTASPRDGDRVLAVHPDYPWSYLPGTVIEKESDNTLFVELSDGEKSQREVEETDFVISEHQFERTNNAITEMANRWAGESVIARRKDTGQYHLGTVIDRFNGSYIKFKVKWSHPSSDESDGPEDTPVTNGSEPEVVDIEHVFGTLSPLRKIKAGDHVLAPIREKSSLYQPGKVQKMHVEKPPPKNNYGHPHELVYGNRMSTIPDVNAGKKEPKKEEWAMISFVSEDEICVHVDYCFWISQRYYTNAVAAYVECFGGRPSSDL